MCLYPKLIRNRKYTKTKKNGGIIPEMKDERVQFVPIGCTKCMECRKQKARAWSLRLQEEIRIKKKGLEPQFVTLTFSNETYTEIAKQIEGLNGYDLDNEIATLAVRRFLERWRKQYGTSVKHWLITELGQGKHAKWQSTENLHLHGIIWTDNKDDIKKIWAYGHVFIGDYVTEQTVNYMVKYMTKQDPLHQEYTPKILTSPGIGRTYTQRIDAHLNKFKIHGETDETYKTRTGQKIALPIYWRNKIYSEDERELLWLQKLDKKTRYVDGQKISILHGEQTYFNILNIARAKNKRLGYGNAEINWERKMYEYQRRLLNQKKRQTKLAQLQTP